MHQNSAPRMLTESRAGSIKPRRIARKVFAGAGLYLLVTPKGGAGGTLIAFRASIRPFLWGSSPTFLLIWLGLDMSLPAICSPKESIRQD